MMGERRVMREALFYGFSLERHVPDNHMLRTIDRFVDLSDLRAHLGPYYSDVGRPSIDPELMMRMLIVGYCFGIRSERRLCEEVHLNLAYRWFYRLGLDGGVPDHSTFSKNRHGRFRESDFLRKLFETVVARCMKEGIVGGEAFAVVASIIVADAHRRRGVGKVEDLDPTSSRAVAEYRTVLDDAAFGGAMPVEPKAISPADPAARCTAAADKPAVTPTPTTTLSISSALSHEPVLLVITHLSAGTGFNDSNTLADGFRMRVTPKPSPPPTRSRRA